MGDRLRTHLGRVRQERGLTQQELADRVGVTRQSLSTIEAGRSVPSTSLALRLAHTLGCRIEDLFRLDAESSSLEVELAHSGPPRAAKGDRLSIASVSGRWIAHPLHASEAASLVIPADAIVSERARVPAATGRPSLVRVKLLRDRRELSGTLLCVGCAPAMGVLAARGSEPIPSQRIVWLEQPSSTALEMLRRGHAHVAGAHLYDEPTGEFNVPFVRRLFPDASMLVVTLARWEAGLVVARGNPRRLRRVDDVARPGLRIAQRAPGSGAQKLLQRLLARAGAPAEAAATRGPMVHGHLDVARAVALGAADVGVAIRSAARAYGLDFVPLAEERFDLVLRKDLSDDARIVRLLNILASRTFRQELESFGGYATRESGSIVAETARA